MTWLVCDMCEKEMVGIVPAKDTPRDTCFECGGVAKYDV